MSRVARRIALVLQAQRRRAGRTLRELPGALTRELRHRRRPLPRDDGPRAALVLALGAPRVGSNLVNDRLKHMAGNLAVNELFLPDEAIGLRHLPELQDRLLGPGIRITDDHDPRGVAACAADPPATVDHLRAIAAERGCATVTLKLFHTHLCAVDRRHLIATPPAFVLVLTRRRIDRFISIRKARLLDTHAFADTTDLHPRVRVAEFHRLSVWADHLLQRMIDAVARGGLPWARLDYDTAMARGPATLDTALNAIWAAAGQAGRIPPDAPAPRLTRQDRTADSFAKIADGAAFRAELDQLGLLDWALRSPAGDLRWPARGRIEIDGVVG